MTAVHIHLLLNHIPILGVLFGLLLLIYGAVKKTEEIERAGLVTFIVVALITVPVFFSGLRTAHLIGNLPDIPKDIITQHQAVAQFMLLAVVLLGAVALLSLRLSRRSQPVPQWIKTAVFVLATISSGLGVWTGSLGGQIRHSEVQADFSK